MSTFFRWLLVVLALTTAVTLTQLWIRGEARTASSMLDSARERWRDQDPEGGDFDGALRELELALVMARNDEDLRVEREILLERVRLHNYRGNYILALEESDFSLGRFDAKDPELLLLAADAALGCERPETTLFYAERLLEVSPEHGGILILIGQAQALMADLALEKLDELLHENLADEPARIAARAARRAAAHPPGSLKRQAALEDLYSQLADSELNRMALESVEQASDHLLDASRAFVGRLRHKADGHAVAGMQGILLNAGDSEEAVDLGRLALKIPSLTWRPTVLIRTAMALDELDRSDQARALIAEVQRTIASGKLAPRTLTDDELYDWSMLLYRLELWGGLVNAGNLLRQRENRRQRARKQDDEEHPHDGMADFFQGMARANKGLSRNARRNLKLFQRDLVREAFPGILLQSWLGLAMSARDLGRGANERYALYQATRGLAHEFDDPKLSETAGEIWLRLGEFQMIENNAMGAENSFAHALRLLPRRRDEIDARWREAGEIAIGVRSNRRFLAVTNAKLAPYEVLTNARSKLEQGTLQEAIFMVERILENFPGLPAALELQAEVEYERGHFEHAIDALLELAEKGFYEPNELELLTSIPYEEFQGEQLIRWMLFDPRSAGLVSVARELERSGRASLALQTLRAYNPRKMASAEIAFFARLLAQAGEWEQAGRLLTHLPPEDPLIGSVSVLAIRAALEADPSGSAGNLLPTVIQIYAPQVPPQDPELPELIDLLLTRGEVGAARTIIEAVDEHEGEQAADVLIRLAVVHTILGNDSAGAEALERSEPFFEDEEASLGWLVRAADDRNFEQLVTITGELYESRFTNSELRRALLTTIENPRAGQRQLSLITGLDDDPRLLFALEVAGDWITPNVVAPEPVTDQQTVDTSDPALDRNVPADDGRFLIPLVIALESRPWAAWSLARLEDLPEPLASSPAAQLLFAYCLMQLGDLERADEHLVALLEQLPELRAAWVLREELAFRHAGSYEDENFLELRIQRLDAIGELDTPAREVALARAFEARLADRHDDAVAILERALLDEPDDFTLRRELARLFRLPGMRVRALEEYNRLFNQHGSPETREILPEVLALLRAARHDAEIAGGVWWAELEALESQFPEEPAVARELAERTIAAAEEGRTDWGVEQAWDHLDRFRERTGHVPVESLRAGEAEAWTQLYRQFDPDRAVEFAYAELTANPVSPELWRAWCEALTDAGERDEAVRAYKAILAVVPEPGLLKSFALLQADRFDDPRAIRASLGGVELFLDHKTTDPDLVFRRGLSLLQGGKAGQRRGLTDMKSVWDGRQQNGIDRARLGRQYAITLFEQGFETLAQNVLREAYLEVRDPLQVSVLQAVANLIRLAARPPDPQGDVTPSAETPAPTEPEAPAAPADGKDRRSVRTSEEAQDPDAMLAEK